jgi:hypothetical protein
MLSVWTIFTGSVANGAVARRVRPCLADKVRIATNP